MIWNEGRWWYRLAHVCQRWRNLILGSASYLRLSLVCTIGTPVANMLAHSPPLPLTVDYFDRHVITTEDEEGILLALEQRHRIRHLRLFLRIQNLQKLVMAIDGEFPILEYLIMEFYPVIPAQNMALPETLQAPNLHHILLKGFAYPIQSRLHPTPTGLVTLYLRTVHPSAYFQPNVLLQWISFMPQLERLVIAFTFPVPNRDLKRQLTHAPVTTHITLPNLRLFWFRGENAYLEAFVGRITAPRLENLHIRLLEQPTFSVPRFSQFMNTAENLRLYGAKVMFKDEEIELMMFPRGTNTVVFGIRVYCWHLDWQVSSAAQIFNALSQAFSPVEHLTIIHRQHIHSPEEHNNVDRIEWRNLLRSFSNVKTLRIKDGLVGELSRCLRLEDGEVALELLPELQELKYPGSSDSGDAFTPFIDARKDAGRPVTLVRET